ncbi:MAG: hypothetical protein JW751_20790 [Polyangiaceae bacterium]|nr:hypothetical protein [Polyangiaceae bacterium]
MTLPAQPLAVPDGADLLEALRQALGGVEGWVQAVGQVDGVWLRVAGEITDATCELRGRFTLVSLGGPAGGPYLATLGRHTDSGLEVVGGMIVRARASGVTAALLPFFATSGTASTNPVAVEATGAVEHPQKGHSTSVLKGPLPSQWAAVAAASAEAATEEEPGSEADTFPERGDRVQHFAFGLCDVLMSSGESLKIRDVQGTGRVREIRVDKLTVLGPTVRDGKRVFRLLRRD